MSAKAFFDKAAPLTTLLAFVYLSLRIGMGFLAH